jgi:hypothetical protein
MVPLILFLVLSFLGLFNSNTSIANPLSVPFIHQLCDTPDDFNGCWACGATSAVMILAYHGRLNPWPFEPIYCSPQPRVSNYGNYISQIYTYGEYIFDTMTYEPAVGTCGSSTLIPGDPAYGAYGYIHYNSGFAKPSRARDYFMKHGLNSEVIICNGSCESIVKAEIDSKRPVWASTNLWPSGHIVVIKGYTYEGISNKGTSCATGCYIVNDPLPHDSQWENREGENYKYTWAEMETGSKWIVTAVPADTTPPRAPTNLRKN